MTRYRYVTCDVFTDTAFQGNPLAVVLDAQGLDSDRMQTIAREFNLSETTFVLPPVDPQSTARVRIFTPGGELPFAGHPTVGTAFVLATLGLAGNARDRITLEEGVGPVPVDLEFDASGAHVVRCTLTTPRTPERLAAGPARGDVAAMLGLAAADLTHDTEVWSCGVPYLVVPMTLEALSRAALDGARWRSLLTGKPTREVYPVAPAGDRIWRVRMFAPGHGVAEDPATGSAAAALAGWLARREERDGHARWTVLQGQEIGRPSRIELEAEVGGDVARSVRVGGAAVLVSEGELIL
jgi:trans-2,3-dihydro-3-hydroxyanthranilate isomerase